MRDSQKWLVQDGGEEQSAQAEEKQAMQAGEERSLLDIERRLSAYYGPALPAHPLPEVAWLRLRDQLHPHAQPRRSRFVLAVRGYQRARQAVPLEHVQFRVDDRGVVATPHQRTAGS